MKQVFIDTNILLNFYEGSKERISLIDEIIALYQEGKIQIIMPLQVIFEFRRNKFRIARERVEILKNYSKFSEKQLDIPIFLKHLKLNTRINKYKENVQHLLSKAVLDYKEKFDNPKSKINTKIGKLFEISVQLEERDDVIQKAYFRTIRGNPPRPKKGLNSFGDAIIWESLLEFCTQEKSNLILVSGDGGFESERVKGYLHEFLAWEWQEKFNSEISFFTTLGEFVNSFTKKEVVSKEEINIEKDLNRQSQIFNITTSGTLSPSDYGYVVGNPNIIGSNYISLSSSPSVTNASDTSFVSSAPNYTTLYKPRCKNCGNEIEDSFLNISGFCNNCLDCKVCGDCGEVYKDNRLTISAENRCPRCNENLVIGFNKK